MDYGQLNIGHMPLEFQNTPKHLAAQHVIDRFYSQPGMDVRQIEQLSMEDVDPNADVHTDFDGYNEGQAPNRYAVSRTEFTAKDKMSENDISFDNDILFRTGIENVDILAAGDILIAGDMRNSELDSNAINIEAPVNKIVIAGDVKENSTIHMSGRHSRLEIMGDVDAESAKIFMSKARGEVYIHGTLHPNATINAARIVYDIASGTPKVKEGNNQAEAKIADATPNIEALERPQVKIQSISLN